MASSPRLGCANALMQTSRMHQEALSDARNLTQVEIEPVAGEHELRVRFSKRAVPLVVPCAFFARVLTCRVHIPFFVLLCLHCSELDAARQGFEKEKLAFERELEQLRAAQPTGRRKKFF